MRNPYRNLRQSSPELPIRSGRVLPDRFEDLMSRERPTAVQHQLGALQRLGRWQRRFVDGWFGAGRSIEGAAEVVAGSGVAGMASLVAVPVTAGR